MKNFLLVLAAFCVVGLANAIPPQRLPEGPKPLPVKVNTKVIEGHYVVKGADYKSTAYIVKPKDADIYVVYQYTGAIILKGVGFMDGDRFVVGWDQTGTIGSSSIRFRDGKGQASWVSNPGNGRVNQETWTLIEVED